MTAFNEKKQKYALACVTSMGVRISPADEMPTQRSRLFRMQATSAETNVLSVAASLGLPCLALTRFVQGSPVSAFIKSELRARGIAFEGPDVPQCGPWGERHQFNIADAGFGLRAPRVWNDRTGEVGRGLCAGDFDAARIFGEEGVGILHLSGLVAAISESSTRCCLELAAEARRRGTWISFDLNHRASFWAGRDTQLRAAFDELASSADVLIGNEEDFQLCLGLEGPEPGGRELAGKIRSFQAMAGRVRDRYPRAKVIATTLRQAVHANAHLWGALLLRDGEWYVEPPREMPVLDRIGGGDGFAGGLLYGLLRGWTSEDCLRFGWACGALAASGPNDYAEPADERQVWDIYAGNARVQR